MEICIFHMLAKQLWKILEIFFKREQNGQRFPNYFKIWIIVDMLNISEMPFIIFFFGKSHSLQLINFFFNCTWSFRPVRASFNKLLWKSPCQNNGCVYKAVLPLSLSFWVLSKFPWRVFCLRLNAKVAKLVDRLLWSSTLLGWGYRLIGNTGVGIVGSSQKQMFCWISSKASQIYLFAILFS